MSLPGVPRRGLSERRGAPGHQVGEVKRMSVPDEVALRGGAAAPDDAAVAGSPKAQRLIKRIGLALGALWLVVGLAVISGVLGRETVEAYRLGSEKGELWMQLMLYPFVSFSAGGLLVNLVWLAGLVRVARRRLTPAGFIRIYSLGTVGVGLMYWALSNYLAGGQRTLTGSYLALFTLHGALTVPAPDETLFPNGGMFTDMKPLLMFSYVVCAAFDSLWGRGVPLGSTVIVIEAIGTVVPTMIVLGLMASVRLRWWGVLLLLSDLWFGVWLQIVGAMSQGFGLMVSLFLVFILGEVVALAVGLLYGWAEKLYSKHEARLRAA
jgi:hypothetical protein